MGCALLAGVPGDGLLVEEGELVLVLGAAVGGGFVVPEHTECLLGPTALGEGAARLLLLLPESVELAGGFGLCPPEVVEEAGAAPERSRIERALGGGGARVGALPAGGGEAFLLLPAREHRTAERVLGLLRLVVAEVENSLQ